LQKRPPERHIFANPDLRAQHFPHAIGADAGGDEHGHRGDTTILPDALVARVEPDVGVISVQAAIAERLGLGVEAGA